MELMDVANCFQDVQGNVTPPSFNKPATLELESLGINDVIV